MANKSKSVTPAILGIGLVAVLACMGMAGCGKSGPSDEQRAHPKLTQAQIDDIRAQMAAGGGVHSHHHQHADPAAPAPQ